MNHDVADLEKIWPLRSTRERVSELLARYPRVTAEEASEILLFVRSGQQLDIGLLSSNDRLRPNLEHFIRDNERHFRFKWREGAAVAGGILVMLITAWLIWAALAEAAFALAGTASGRSMS
jgi:hypothetical protein